jgi:dephospho-CoA kinase
VLREDGSLDREALAGAVFADPAARRDLEAIVHPEVQRMFLAAVEPNRDTDRVVVYVVPLLVERNLRSMFDVVVTVSADEETRVARVVNDRGLDPSAVRARLAAQASDGDREHVADAVLRNDGSPADLERSVDELWSRLRLRASAEAPNDVPR